MMLIIALVVGVTMITADEKKATVKPVWQTNLKTAAQMARKLDRPILMNFTGSDWCGWCVKLKKEVFDTKEFKEYASKNLILMEVDFPRSKKQPAKLKKQNKALAAQYKIKGYPTVIIVNSKGKEIARTGYKKGGGAKYAEHLKELLSKK